MTTPTDRAAPRKGNVKARRMDGETFNRLNMKAKKISISDYLKNPTAASYERMVEQMARPIHEASKMHRGIRLKDYPWSDVSLHNQEGYRNVARAALASLGIQPPVAQTRRRGRK